jgi:hypothetical protein
MEPGSLTFSSLFWDVSNPLMRTFSMLVPKRPDGQRGSNILETNKNTVRFGILRQQHIESVIKKRSMFGNKFLGVPTTYLWNSTFA